MQILTYLFWGSLAIILYTYVGYGILLLVLTGIKQLLFRSNFKSLYINENKYWFPGVTVVIAAYNEETIIEAKIDNCLRLNYPVDKLQFLFITDGSNDNTAAIISQYPQIRLLHQSTRKGKTAALNRAMMQVTTPIAVFCDANTILNRSAITRLVRHYLDPNIGGVAGEKKIMTGKRDGTAAAGEGLYWKYESFLKRLDSELYTVAGAAGELFSIRTSLWKPIPEDTVLDDFIISANINIHGYRIAYEPTAYACELPSVSLNEEKKRKIRISAGAFQAMGRVSQIFNIFRHPVLSFQFLSHRVLRWTLTPLSLPILLMSNILLVAGQGRVLIYNVCLLGQLIFYGSAIVGAILKYNSRLTKILRISYYILFMNLSVYLGFFRFLRGRQTAVWEKAKRTVAPISA